MKISEGLNNVLLRLVGVAPQSVAGEEFAEVRIRYVALALVTIMISLLAGNSMGFAVYTLTGSARAYAAVAAVWSFFILAVESFLIVSLKPTFTSLALVAIGVRLSMALLVSQLASVPAEQAIFAPEIANEISIAMRDELSADKAAFADEYKSDLEALARQRGELQGRLNELQTKCNDKYEAYVKEWKGIEGDGLSGVFGPGRLTKINEMEFNACNTELIRQEDEGQKDSLAARMKAVSGRIAEVEAVRDQRLGKRKLAIEANNGLLARIEALHRLMGRNSEVWLKVWLLRLFILVLETLPLTGKIFMLFSPFERLRVLKENTGIQSEAKKLKAGAEKKRQYEVTELSGVLRAQEFVRAASAASYAQARGSDEFDAATRMQAKEIVDGLKSTRRVAADATTAASAAVPNGNGRRNGGGRY